MDSERTRTEQGAEGYEYIAVFVYRDALGNDWWAFKEPTKMPPGRAIAAELAAEWANLNITPADFDAFFDAMEEHFNTGNHVMVATTMRLLRERRKWAMEGRTLMELAKCYFMIGDEPLSGSTEMHDAMKEAAWKQDTACRGFFLHRAFVLTKGFSEFSPTDILAYLKAQELIALKTMLRALPTDTVPDTAKPLSRRSFTAKGKTSTPRSPSPVAKSPAK